MTEETLRDDGMSGCAAGLERVCALLQNPTPEALETAAVILGSLVRNLTYARATVPTAPEAHAAIRRTLRLARMQLEKTSAYHMRWQTWMGIRAAGYGPCGEAAAHFPPRRVSLQG